MSNDRLKYLIEQYVSNSSSPEEIQELFNWIKKSNDDVLIKAKIEELFSSYDNKEVLPDVDWESVYLNIISAPDLRKKTRILPRVAIAALITGVLLSGMFFLFFNKKATDGPDQGFVFTEDIKAPETNKAIITLGDGSVVYLDSIASGAFVIQGDVKITKLPNGQISYESVSDMQGFVNPVYNTLFNPKGSEIINLTLNDGSKVWLNSGSSISYPVVFSGAERKVQITGEAYFEVTHDLKKAFIVEKDDMEVQVLGTNFNINAYDDEDDIKVTLLEGSVKIENGLESKVITPGQQVIIKENAEMLVRNSVNLEAVIAWKNGRFVFEEENIQSVMRQISRWYNVEVTYEGEVTNEKFVGVISRSRYQNISKILDLFEKTGIVKFSIDGEKVTVKPNK